jgi:hypothetical protein
MNEVNLFRLPFSCGQDNRQITIAAMNLKALHVLARSLVLLISDETIRHRVQGISNGDSCFILSIVLTDKEQSLVY